MNDVQESSVPDAVVVENLSQRFGRTEALNDVSLTIPQGTVFGLLGLNGAGKTTLLRHLLGLHQPRVGSVRVLGCSPITDREKVMRRIGYLSEEDSLPTWMRVRDLTGFCEAIYPRWDRAYAAELCEWFELSPDAKLRSLSKGGRARAGLIAAIAHKPDLLVLDEPGSGLDPIARDDILQAIIRTVSLEGRTVIFSSHLLDEVSRVCDQVAIMHQGKLIESMPMMAVDERYEEWILRSRDETITTQHARRDCPVEAGLGWYQEDGEWSLVVPRQSELSPTALPPDWQWIESRHVTLKRLFEAHVRAPRQSVTAEARDDQTSGREGAAMETSS
ncbi:ABC transporter ATP-binding protein [Rhodopirellula bahusiensis]|uniref:Multidrug ABC transporter ATP-binding protein n=1 Tax=Rhodopirellula bahusiensis TaxID=2014065 RepID=A0A2G1W059_9BACT|nr:ATP-binding cassette domain-containing protein [Rhodopirellula bahusiensis]PHQ32422.1 multidrug ABC transporter ATP-binding protein [Rhodopirellula bahusiensis]